MTITACTPTLTFQSTPSGRKATLARPFPVAAHQRFNPRLPGGRRLTWCAVVNAENGFNPRLPGGRRPRSSNAA